MFNDTCISFSDDDLPGKKKSSTSTSTSTSRIPLLRRKCRKLGFRAAKTGCLQTLFRIVIKWWPLLLFLPALGLLLFEASKLGAKRPQQRQTREKVPVVVPEKNGELESSSLNRLDPVTRRVNGVQQPCLKILPPDALKHLDIPLGKETKSPVRRVIYKSDDHASYLGGNTTLFQRSTEVGRFNSFTGSQTMLEREKSFEVNETVAVHCGFYSEEGGFKISDEDKNYMRTCKVVVSTCTFGGGDDLYQPIGMSDASLMKVCYVAFWDDITLATQEESGKKVGVDHMIGKWRIVIVKDLPFTDQRLNGKIPKMLSHRLFPQARFSIWVDSKSQFRRDPLGVLEALLWRTNSVLAISEHGARSSVYDEGKAVVTKNKATPEEVDVQLTQYRRDRLPNDKRFNGKKALSEASVIVRENMPMTNLFMCLWFNEVVRFTSRDQLSFPYVLWRLNMKNINMFPVCTRRDLVNSIGHIRKAKPLTN